MRKTGKPAALLPPVLLLLAVLAVCCLAVTRALAAGTASAADLTYTVNGDGTVTVTGCEGTPARLTIPPELDGKPVTAIGSSAFAGRGELKEVTIPDSVTGMGSAAFQDCTGLKSVTMPAPFLNDGYFSGCTSVGRIRLTGSLPLPGVGYGYASPVPSLGAGKGLEVIIDDTVPGVIGKRMFSGCTGLTRITIGSGITEIGGNVFEGCTGLTKLSLGDGLTAIGGFAFSGCSGLTEINLPEGLKTIGRDAFNGCAGLTEIAFPAELESIGMGAFAGCTGLTGIEIPGSVTDFGWNPFSGCTGLASVRIPAVLAGQGFDGCTSISSVTLTGDAPSLEAIRQRFDYSYRYTAPWLAGGGAGHPVRVAVEGRITAIGDYAFSDCAGLTEINLPKGLRTIGAYAFNGCAGLEELVLPAGLESIGQHAFAGCTGLTEIEIPESVTGFGWNPFTGCTGLASVRIPAALAGQGFDGCTAVSSVTLTGYGASLEPQLQKFGYSKRYTMPWTAAGGAGNPVRVTAGDGVTAIGDNAFAGCVGLREIRLGTGVRTIGVSAFNGCTGLAGSLTLPAGLTSIGNGAFFGCSGLTGTLTLPTGLETLGDEAFSHCSGFTGSLTLPAKLTRVGYSAFSGCAGLSGALTLPAELESIGDNAFEGCAGLKGTLTFPAGLVTIGRSAFYGCAGLTGISTFGNSLETIGDGAFQDCTALGGSTLRFPGTLVSIGDRAFYNTAYTNGEMYAIYFPASLASVGTYAFSGGDGAVRTAYGDWRPAMGNPVPVDYVWCGCSEFEFTNMMSFSAPGQTQFGPLSQWEFKYRKVYVVNEIFPDSGAEPAGVSITGGAPAMQVGTVMKLKAVVSPAQAKNKTVTWSVSDESVATVSRNGEVTAAAAGTVTVTASTVNGLSASRTVTVADDLCIIHVYGVDLEGRDRSLADQLAASYEEAVPLEGAEVTIGEVTCATDADGQAVFRANQFPEQGYQVTGEIRVSAGDGYFPKSGRAENGLVVSYGAMPELMLNYTNDFYLESKGDDIYILEAMAWAGGDHDLLGDKNDLIVRTLKEDGTANDALYPLYVRVDWNRYPIGTISMAGLESGKTVALSQGVNQVALGTAFDPNETVEMRIETVNELGLPVSYAVPLKLRLILPPPKLNPPPTEQLAVGGETKDGGLYFLKDLTTKIKFSDLAKLATKISCRDGVLTMEFEGKDSETTEADVFYGALVDVKHPEVKVTGTLQIPLGDRGGPDDPDKNQWKGELEFSWMNGTESKDWQSFAKKVSTEASPEGNALDRMVTLFQAEFDTVLPTLAIPIYLDAEVKAGVKGSLALHGPYGQVHFSGQLGINGEGSIGAGIGGAFSDDYQLKAGGKGKLEADLPVIYDTDPSTNDGKLVRFDPSLTGTVSVEVKAKAGLIEITPELELGSFTWDKDGVSWGDKDAVMQSGADWRMVSRAEASGGRFAGDAAALMDGERQARVFWENIQSGADAVLAVEDDGTLLLYAAVDDPDRGEADRLRLAVSAYDPETGTWSAPAWIGTDGTLDSAPDAEGGFVVWEDSDRTFAPEEGLEAVLKSNGVAAAVRRLDGTFAVTRLTEADDVCYFGPKVAAAGDTAFAAWLSNSAADLTGQTGRTGLYGAFYRDGAWSEVTTLAADIGQVTNLNVRWDGETAEVLYKNGTVLTALTPGGSGVRTENVGRYAAADGLLAFFTDRTLHVLENGTEVCTAETYFSGGENPVAVGGGNPAVLWTEEGGIFCVTRTDSGWTGRLCLQGTENPVSGLSAVSRGQEGLAVSWLEQTGERTDLMTLLAAPGTDLALLSAEYDEAAYYETGLVTWTAYVYNNGETEMPDGTVRVYDAGGREVSSAPLPLLSSGEGGTVTGQFAPAADGAFTLRIEAEGDCRPANDNAGFTIGGTDAAVEDAWFLGDALYVRAANRAGAPVGGTLTVRAGGRDGDPAARADLEPLARGESRVLTLPLIPEAGTVYYVMLDCPGDENPGDNLYLVSRAAETVRSDSGQGTVFAALSNGELILRARPGEPDFPEDTQVVAAVCGGDGRLLSSHRLAVSPREDGILTASAALEDLPEDGTVRVFFLDPETAAPLREAITLQPAADGGA